MSEREARPCSSYVHGSDALEQARLGLMNGILNGRHLAALGLRGGEQVLALGAGTGIFARELARAAGPQGRVVAVERDERQIATARELCARPSRELAPIELRAGDVYELPLASSEWGSFDVVHARFLLEHLSDPAAVVALMLRAARPGGRVVLADDDHDVLRLDPPAPAFEELWRAYAATYTRAGNDPGIGRRLVGLLAAAGAEPQRNEWIFFGSCKGAADFDAVVDNMSGILLGARAAILEDLAPERFELAMRELAAWRERSGAAVWFAMCLAEGRRPR